MEAVKILTDNAPEWIDAHISPPESGSRVQGLTIGGCQVSLVWTSESIKFIDAWHKHLKVPKSVKDRQMARYMEITL
jgi:hypothetical protein